MMVNVRTSTGMAGIYNSIVYKIHVLAVMEVKKTNKVDALHVTLRY